MRKKKLVSRLGLFKLALLLFSLSIGFSGYAQQQTISGVVSDKEGTLPGVSVLIKGTDSRVLTDDQGRFTISAPIGSTLVVSFMGMQEKEVTIGNRTTINVLLDSEIDELDEVVVVAYGKQKRSTITGSIAVINSDKLKTVTTPNVNSMLQGKVAGVYVETKSGRPGEAANIRIRGKATLQSGSVDPLWVIDGVVAGTGAQLSPNDIENISVLKDASATALYGSRAANGVIIVTTKGGRHGQSTINVSAKLGVATMSMGKFNMMNSQELYDYTGTMDRLELQMPFYNEKLLEHNTDWFDLATQTALSQNYTVSHTVGTDKMSSFLSGDYYTEEGTIQGFKYNRFSLRNNVDYKLNNKVTLKTRIAGTYWNDDNKQRSLALTNLPWDHPYNADGTIRTGKETATSGDEWYGRDKNNYLYDRQWNWARGKQLGVDGTLGLEYKILDFLTFETTNNIGYRYHLTESYTDPRSQGGQESKGSLTNSNSFTTTRYTNHLLRFGKTFNSVHDVSAFIGYEYSDYKYESNGATGNGISVGKEILDVTANAYKVNGTKNEWAVQSGYFNANYTYDNRYMAQVSFRYDGSSRFGSSNRYGSFYTIGGGWTISNESFMSSANWVNQLKLRASFGSIGNMPTNGYSHLTTYTVNGDYLGTPIAFPGTLGNPNLKWEKCYETNIAVDARFFDRVNLTVDYYDKNTSGLLYAVRLPALSGYTSQHRNVGRVTNRGIEVTISPEIIKTKNFQWDMSFNIGYNKDNVKELLDGRPMTRDYIKRYEEGYPIDSWYLPEWAGVDPLTGDPMWYRVNDDGSKSVTSTYSDATFVMSGSINPNIYGGVITNFTYKDFSLAAAFSFVSGNKIYHSAREMYDNDGAYPTFNSMKLKDGWNRWEKEGDIATHPRAVAGGNKESNKQSTRYLEKGDYFRLNNVTLSYNIPQALLHKIGFKGGTVSLSGENLFTITKFSGIDPAIGGGNGTSDTGVYPSVRRFSFGLNFSF